MLGEAMAGYQALKSALEIVKGLKDIDDRVRLNSAVIELQSQILEAQAASLGAGDLIAELKGKIQSYEDWTSVASRYRLRDYGGSTFAYELLVEYANGEPSHRACANCFQNRKRAILQFGFRNAGGRDNYRCVACNNEFEFGDRREQSWSRKETGGWAG